MSQLKSMFTPKMLILARAVCIFCFRSLPGAARSLPGLFQQQKKGPENTKIELNGVARPRFGPILSGNVAVDSLMLLVASEPSQTL